VIADILPAAAAAAESLGPDPEPDPGLFPAEAALVRTADPRRRAEFTAAVPTGLSGYGELFVRHVSQANLGCDFDFLQRRVGVQEPVIH